MLRTIDGRVLVHQGRPGQDNRALPIRAGSQIYTDADVQVPAGSVIGGRLLDYPHAGVPDDNTHAITWLNNKRSIACPAADRFVAEYNTRYCEVIRRGVAFKDLFVSILAAIWENERV